MSRISSRALRAARRSKEKERNNYLPISNDGDEGTTCRMTLYDKMFAERDIPGQSLVNDVTI